MRGVGWYLITRNLILLAGSLVLFSVAPRATVAVPGAPETESVGSVAS